MLLSVVLLSRLCLRSTAVLVIPADRVRPSARSQLWGFYWIQRHLKKEKKNLSELKSNLKTRGVCFRWKKQELRKKKATLYSLPSVERQPWLSAGRRRDDERLGTGCLHCALDYTAFSICHRSRYIYIYVFNIRVKWLLKWNKQRMRRPSSLWLHDWRFCWLSRGNSSK